MIAQIHAGQNFVDKVFLYDKTIVILPAVETTWVASDTDQQLGL